MSGKMYTRKLYISTVSEDSSTPRAVNADLDQTDYQALCWTEIFYIANISDLRPVANMKTYKTLSGEILKIDGAFNAGDLCVHYRRSAIEPGQLALRNASETSNYYAFRIQTVNRTLFSRGLVMRPKIDYSGYNDFICETTTLGLVQPAIESHCMTEG